MTDQAPLHALVLAGGESRRMGVDKAAIKVDGVTQLARTAGLVTGLVERCFVSVRDPATAGAMRASYPMIADSDIGRGPLAGILAALTADQSADWLVLACDLPKLDRATVEHLIAARDTTSPAIAYRSERDGLPEPMCAIWRQPMAARIRARLRENLFCARKCLILADTLLLDPVSPGALANMNTPEDQQRLIAASG